MKPALSLSTFAIAIAACSSASFDDMGDLGGPNDAAGTIDTGAASLGGFFADAGCTTPIAVTRCGAGAPAYAEQADTNQRLTIYPITSAFTGQVHSGRPGACSTLPSSPQLGFYNIGNAVPPSTFVSVSKLGPGQAPAPASTDIVQNGTRLRLQTVSTSDGASGPWYFADSQLSAECYFSLAGDRTERCVPIRTTSVSGYFSNATCADPVLATPLSSPMSWDYAYTTDSRSCATSSYYRVGAPYTGTLYWNALSSCSVAPVDATRAYYSLTPFPVSNFQGAGASTSGGSFAGSQSGSRIKLVTTTSTDGAREFSGFRDTQLGIDCYFGRAVDGALRCLPRQMGYVFPYYADAACTQQLLVASGCETPLYATAAGTCSASYYQVGAPYTGTMYYKSNTMCTAIAGTLSPPLYRIGGTVSAGTFAAGTLSE